MYTTCDCSTKSGGPRKQFARLRNRDNEDFSNTINWTRKNGCLQFEANYIYNYINYIYIHLWSTHSTHVCWLDNAFLFSLFHVFFCWRPLHFWELRLGIGNLWSIFVVKNVASGFQHNKIPVDTLGWKSCRTGRSMLEIIQRWIQLVTLGFLGLWNCLEHKWRGDPCFLNNFRRFSKVAMESEGG
jgi:hypothetical protein